MQLKYFEILKLNKELGKSLNSNDYGISVLSNIIVYQIKEILESIVEKIPAPKIGDNGSRGLIFDSFYDQFIANSRCLALSSKH